MKTGAAVSNAVKSVISKPAVSLGNTSRSSGGTASAYAKVSGVVRNQAAQKKAAKSAAWADFVGQPLTVCEAAAVWADWGAEKAAGYMDESLWGLGLMIGAYEVEAVKCFAYSQLENSIHLIIPEADVERMLKGAGLMLGGGFKSFGGAMLAAGSSTVSWAGIGVPGMIAGGFVIGAGISDMEQGGEEFFLGMSGDSTTQTRNGMSDLFYDGNDTIYHLSTGVAAFAGSLLTPYVAYAAKTATAGSTVVEPTVAGPSLVQQGEGYGLKEAATKISPVEGYTDVAIHGTPDSFGVWHNGKWEYIDQRSLATFLKNNPEYNGGAVRLISCSTGAKPDGIAQQLANKLGVDVLAPSDTLYIYQDGSTVIGPNPYTNTGDWELFMPGKH